MILYFTGTGNSRRVANSLGILLNERIVEIPKSSPYNLVLEGCSLGIVCPVYSWGIPPIVTDFLFHLNQIMVQEIKSKTLPVWVVLTYGDDCGEALTMMRKALKRIGLNLSGAWGIKMPNVYVLLPGFDVDRKELERRKLEESHARIQKIAVKISGGDWEFKVNKGSFPKLKTILTFPLFKRWGVNPRRWNVDASLCIGCGRCMNTCPVSNIALDAKMHPIWGIDCTSCCGCYHVCPVHAINYSTLTQKKGQYHPE